MTNPSHDLLLLLLNLSQQKSADRIIETFMDAVKSLFEPCTLRWLVPDHDFSGEPIPVATRSKQYGTIVVDLPDENGTQIALSLLRNAASMLAVILEKLETDQLLSDEKKLLQAQVDKQTAELIATNKELRHEIDDRIRAEDALRESDERARSIIDQSKAGYFFIDNNGLYQNVNNAWLAMHGYSSEQEVIGRHFIVTQYDADIDKAKIIFDAVLSEKLVPNDEFSRKLKDGSIGYHTYTVNPVKINGNVVGLEGFIFDTSDRKKAEEALRLSEDKFKKAFHSSPDAITITSLETGLILEANEGFTKVFGHPIANAVGKSTLELGIWKSSKSREKLLKSFGRDGRLHNTSIQLLSSAGKTLDCLIDAQIIELDGQKCMLAITRDITEKKRAEEALRSSEERFSKAFNLSPDSVMLNRVSDGLVIDVNRTFEKTYMLPRDRAIGKTTVELDLWYDPTQRDSVLAPLREGRPVINAPIQTKRMDGEVLDALLTAEVLEISGVPHHIAFVRDVTDKKRAEEALRLSEDKFKKAFHASPDAITITSLENDHILEANEGFTKILGYSTAEIIGKSTLELGILKSPSTVRK